MKPIFIVIFITIANLSFAQEKFSSRALSQFVNVYFQEKQLPKIDDSSIKKIFKNYNLTSLEHLSKHQINSAQINSAQISHIQQELHQLELTHQTKHQIELKNICLKNELPYQDYQRIKKNYQNNLYFHRSLKPYFDQYIKSIVNE